MLCAGPECPSGSIWLRCLQKKSGQIELCAQLTIRRKVHVQLAGQEVVALALALVLGGELLRRDLRHLWLPGLGLLLLELLLLVTVSFVLHVEIQ